MHKNFLNIDHPLEYVKIINQINLANHMFDQ